MYYHSVSAATWTSERPDVTLFFQQTRHCIETRRKLQRQRRMLTQLFGQLLPTHLQPGKPNREAQKPPSQLYNGWSGEFIYTTTWVTGVYLGTLFDPNFGSCDDHSVHGSKRSICVNDFQSQPDFIRFI